MPVVVIATSKGTYDKVLSNIQEVKARKGKIIAIVTEGDKDVKKLADYVVEVPKRKNYWFPSGYDSVAASILSYCCDA